MTSVRMEGEIADLNFIGFNQDAKSLSIGHHRGYTIYTLGDMMQPPTLAFDCDSQPDTLMVERMFSSSLIALVTRRNPRLMQVYHFTNRSVICEHKFGSSIMNVKMNRERLIVCLEECIHVYALRDMRVMHTICDTPPNRTGMIDLSAGGNVANLAYPGSTTSGTVHIFDAMSLTSVNTFIAHDNPLSALRFNSDGSKIATASTKGTVIRVFSVPNGTRLFEFQRGVRPATIHSLCFSADSQYLSSSSTTETIHVYKLAKPEENSQQDSSNGGWLGYFQQQAQAYLPVGEFIRFHMTYRSFREAISEKDFALARLPVSHKSVASLIAQGGHQYLVVASTDGFLYIFRVPPEGGQCELLKQHRVGVKGTGSGGTGGTTLTTGAAGGPDSQGTPIRPARASDSSRDRLTPPDTSNLDEFPPMSHTSGH